MGSKSNVPHLDTKHITLRKAPKSALAGALRVAGAWLVRSAPSLYLPEWQ